MNKEILPLPDNMIKRSIKLNPKWASHICSIAQ